MKIIYLSYWRNSMQHMKMLDFYRVFKNVYSQSDYLTHLRRPLFKFKISNHKLIVEVGRYQTDHIHRGIRLRQCCKFKSRKK